MAKDVGLRAELVGLDKFLDKLKTLKQSAQNKVLRPAVFKAARLVKDAVKAIVPVGETGNLRRSIYATVGVEGTVVIGLTRVKRVFARTMKKQKVKARVFYAWIVEGGARPHALGGGSSLRGRKGGGQTGRLHPGFAPRHFMLRGWNSSKNEASALVLAEAAARFQKLYKE